MCKLDKKKTKKIKEKLKKNGAISIEVKQV